MELWILKSQPNITRIELKNIVHFIIFLLLSNKFLKIL